MTLFEYSSHEGLKEILNFMWSPSSPGGENGELAFERLGYKEQDLGLFSDRFAYWITVYKNMGNNEYEYLLSVNNHMYGQYIACRSFADFMEFMKNYLPVIERMNEIAMKTQSTA